MPVDIPFQYKLLFSCTSTVSASLVTHPFDVMKVLLQLRGESSPQRAASSSGMSSIVRNVQTNGVGILYKGITASILRQASYGTVRIALFESFMSQYAKDTGEPAPLSYKLAFGAVAGGIGAVVGNPADMSLVRMAADSKLPPSERRNYGNVFNALHRILREEGILAWWNGCKPTVIRAIAVNISQLPAYAQTKQELVSRGYYKGDEIQCHVSSSLVAGFVATVITQPADVVKTRIQQASLGQYRGAAHCFGSIIRNEGVPALWRGFSAAFARLAPQTTLTFLFLEQFKARYEESQLGAIRTTAKPQMSV